MRRGIGRVGGSSDEPQKMGEGMLNGFRPDLFLKSNMKYKSILDLKTWSKSVFIHNLYTCV